MSNQNEVFSGFFTISAGNSRQFMPAPAVFRLPSRPRRPRRNDESPGRGAKLTEYLNKT